MFFLKSGDGAAFFIGRAPDHFIGPQEK